MNYQSIIRNTTSQEDISRCRHGMQADLCCYCKDVSFGTKRQKRPNANADLIEQYERLKEHFRNFNEAWSEDEFFVVLSNLQEVRGTRQEKREIYKTAIQLGRTKNAIKWAIKHLWGTKEYHRGQVVIEFRKTFGLDKENG